MNKIFIVLALVVLAGVGYYVYTQQDMAGVSPSPSASPTGSPSGSPVDAGSKNAINVWAQVANSVATIDTVRLESKGFVAIHENDANGQPGKIIASSALLNAGLHRNVKITVKLVAGNSYHAMLHKDNGDAKFDAATDMPIKDGKGNIVMMKFAVVAAAVSPKAPVTVTMKDSVYSPLILTVTHGDRVEFKNNDDERHTVTASAFGGGHLLEPGESFVLDTTAMAAGTYSYFCDFHATMTGTLTVK